MQHDPTLAPTPAPASRRLLTDAAPPSVQPPAHGSDGHSKSIIRAHQDIESALCSSSALGLGGPRGLSGVDSKPMEASVLPMLTLPKPWTGLRGGAYLITPQTLVRCGADTFQHLAMLAKAEDSMADVFDAINHISSTPWAINDRVFGAMLPMFSSGEPNSKLDIPAAVLGLPLKPGKDTPPEDRWKLQQEYALAKKLKNENSGLRVRPPLGPHGLPASLPWRWRGAAAAGGVASPI